MSSLLSSSLPLPRPPPPPQAPAHPPLSGFGSGVFQLFYEPAKAVTENPANVGQGVKKGAIGLLKSSTHGLAGSTSSIAGAVGNTLVKLSFDPKFKKQHYERASHSPSTVGSGLAHGAEALRSSVASGLRGVVSKPYKGARDRGTRGLVRGVGQGVLGLLVKPATGVLAFASATAKGVRSSSGRLKANGGRARLPRAIVAGTVARYCEDLALAQHLLRTTHDGKYRADRLHAYLGPLYPAGDAWDGADPVAGAPDAGALERPLSESWSFATDAAGASPSHGSPGGKGTRRSLLRGASEVSEAASSSSAATLDVASHPGLSPVGRGVRATGCGGLWGGRWGCCGAVGGVVGWGRALRGSYCEITAANREHSGVGGVGFGGIWAFAGRRVL